MNPDPSRLDRLEADIETLKQQSRDLAERDQSFGDRQALIEQQVDVLFAALSQTNEVQRSMLNSLERMTETVNRVSQTFEEERATTAAALERIDRILDYLIRRDGDRPA